jgi:hypothetical protein
MLSPIVVRLMSSTDRIMVVQEKGKETDIRGGSHKSTRSKTQARSYELLYEDHVEL